MRDLRIQDDFPKALENRIKHGWNMGSGFESIFSGECDERKLHPVLVPHLLDHMIYTVRFREDRKDEIKDWSDDEHKLLKSKILKEELKRIS